VTHSYLSVYDNFVVIRNTFPASALEQVSTEPPCIFYLPGSCNICYENKFYNMNIGQTAAVYLLYRISKVWMFLSGRGELGSAHFTGPVNMSGV
jgi:hypothetical protein